MQLVSLGIVQKNFHAELQALIPRELLQAQALSKELRMKQNLQKWQQFNSDLNSIWAWLGDTEEELEHLQHLELSTDIHTIELQIKKLKVALLAFLMADSVTA